MVYVYLPHPLLSGRAKSPKGYRKMRVSHALDEINGLDRLCSVLTGVLSVSCGENRAVEVVFARTREQEKNAVNLVRILTKLAEGGRRGCL